MFDDCLSTVQTHVSSVRSQSERAVCARRPCFPQCIHYACSHHTHAKKRPCITLRRVNVTTKMAQHSAPQSVLPQHIHTDFDAYTRRRRRTNFNRNRKDANRANSIAIHDQFDIFPEKPELCLNSYNLCTSGGACTRTRTTSKAIWPKRRQPQARRWPPASQTCSTGSRRLIRTQRWRPADPPTASPAAPQSPLKLKLGTDWVQQLMRTSARSQTRCPPRTKTRRTRRCCRKTTAWSSIIEQSAT